MGLNLRGALASFSASALGAVSTDPAKGPSPELSSEALFGAISSDASVEQSEFPVPRGAFAPLPAKAGKSSPFTGHGPC